MNQPQAARESMQGEVAANVKPTTEPNQGEGESISEYDEDDADVSRRVAEIIARIRQRIRDQPLTATGGAFILGFAFGNGVPKVLGRVGAAMALRVLIQRVLDRNDGLTSALDD